VAGPTPGQYGTFLANTTVLEGMLLGKKTMGCPPLAGRLVIIWELPAWTRPVYSPLSWMGWHVTARPDRDRGRYGSFTQYRTEDTTINLSVSVVFKRSAQCESLLNATQAHCNASRCAISQCSSWLRKGGVALFRLPASRVT
jgi:hypothetical protein